MIIIFFVAGATLLAAFSAGGAVIYPSVLLNQLQTNDTSIVIDFETSTWVGSISGLAGIPTILMPSYMQWRGRKSGFILACLILTIGWIIAISAQSVAAILISECLQGLGSSSIVIMSFLSISEMIAPKYRELVMQGYLLCQCLTMAISGVLFNYLHWKTIAGLMLGLILLSLLVASMWPESPYWLAYKGQITKCKEAFVWLRGSDFDASRELENLLVKQREHFILNRRNPKFSIRQFWRMVTDRTFYVPAFHILVLDCIMYWSGLLVMMIYTVDILKRSTQNETAQYYSVLFLPSMTVFGILLSLIINKFITKKALLLSASCVLIFCLLGASLVTYLQSIGYVSKDSLICVFFYVIYNLISVGGLSCNAYPISSSLMPVKYRGTGGALIVINTSILHSTSLKFAPYLFESIHIWGTLLVYATVIIVCAFIIWIYLPDIEGKTLQDIENYYALGRFDDNVIGKGEEFDNTIFD